MGGCTAAAVGMAAPMHYWGRASPWRAFKTRVRSFELNSFMLSTTTGSTCSVPGFCCGCWGHREQRLPSRTTSATGRWTQSGQGADCGEQGSQAGGTESGRTGRSGGAFELVPLRKSQSLGGQGSRRLRAAMPPGGGRTVCTGSSCRLEGKAWWGQKPTRRPGRRGHSGAGDVGKGLPSPAGSGKGGWQKAGGGGGQPSRPACTHALRWHRDWMQTSRRRRSRGRGGPRLGCSASAAGRQGQRSRAAGAEGGVGAPAPPRRRASPTCSVAASA